MVDVDFLLWDPRSVQYQHVLSWFQASATTYLRSSLLWEITQRIAAIPCRFGLLTLEDRTDRFLETSAKNYYYTLRSFLAQRRSQRVINSVTSPNTRNTLVLVVVLGLCFFYCGPSIDCIDGLINLLKGKRNLLCTRNQSIPRCKHFPPRL